MTQVARQLKYSIQNFTDITFNGFDIVLPEETLAIISELALQVGSPTYIRTPIFAKRDNMCKNPSSSSSTGYSSGSQDLFKSQGQGLNQKKKGKRGNGAQEIVNDEDWETIRTFHTTKIEQKVGIDAQVDLIRSALNKMTDSNYSEKCQNIFEILDSIMCESSQEDILKVCNQIFEIASNNRFYSKLYADLFSDLIKKYQIMHTIFEKSLSTFLELFTNIESANADEDYDRFCKVNSNNERRKALSAFFVNLAAKEIVSQEKLSDLIVQLMKQAYQFIKMDNKKSEVDEIVENLCILYNKDLVEDCEEEIDGKSLSEIIKELGACKAKTWPSLTSKSIFKFMDLLEL
jgi:hypothetical protein